MAVNQEYKEYRVNELPSTGYAGDRYYLNVGGGKFQTYIISDALTPVREAGQEFIECDTVDDLRNLDARQIWAIQNGYYKGVTLNGYYTEGDTPASIDYYLSETEEEDDGGSVFEVSGIKLEHKFVGEINLSYFGLRVGTDVLDNHERVNKALVYSSSHGVLPITSPSGNYDFYNTIQVMVSLTSISGEDLANTTWWYNGNDTFIEIKSPLGSGLQGIKIRKIRFRDRLGEGNIALSFNKVRASIFDDIEIWGSTSLTGWHTAGLYIDGDQLDGSWNNKFKNLRCCNMDGYGHLLRTTQNNAVFFLNASTENCGRSTGVMTWICGGNGISFIDSHFENFNVAIRASPYDSSFFLRNLNIINCYFEPNKDDNDNRCVLISSYDIEGNNRATNIIGLNIDGGYWNGHNSTYLIEVDYQNGNVLNGIIRFPYYRGATGSFLKSSTAGERLKIEGRANDVPLLEDGGASNSYVVENSNGYDIIRNINRFKTTAPGDRYYKIENQLSYLIINSTQELPAESIYTTVRTNPTSENITLTLPPLSELGLENEFFIFKRDSNEFTVTIQPASGNQFNTPLPTSRTPNILKKAGSYIRVIKDTTAGWRIIDSGVLTINSSVVNRNEPNGLRTGDSGTLYFETDNNDNVVDLHLKTLTDDNQNWISIIPKEATPTVKGLVNQSAAEANITTADAADESEAIALVNELKAKINAILTSDRASGQRAT